MLKKEQIAVPLTGGVMTGTAKELLPPGQFLELENAVFRKEGLVQKRNGFTDISTSTVTNTSIMTTFSAPYKLIPSNHGLLIASKNGIFKYVESTNKLWQVDSNPDATYAYIRHRGFSFSEVNESRQDQAGAVLLVDQMPFYHENTAGTKAALREHQLQAAINVSDETDLTSRFSPIGGDYSVTLPKGNSYDMFTISGGVVSASRIAVDPTGSSTSASGGPSTSSNKVFAACSVDATYSLLCGFDTTANTLKVWWWDGAALSTAGTATTIVPSTDFKFCCIGFNATSLRVEVGCGAKAGTFHRISFTYSSVGGALTQSLASSKATSGSFDPVSASCSVSAFNSIFILNSDAGNAPLLLVYYFSSTSSLQDSIYKFGTLPYKWDLISHLVSIGTTVYGVGLRESTLGLNYYFLFCFSGDAQLSTTALALRTVIVAQWGWGSAAKPYITNAVGAGYDNQFLTLPYVNGNTLKCILPKNTFDIDNTGALSTKSRGTALYKVSLDTPNIGFCEWENDRLVIGSKNSTFSMVSSELNELNFFEPTESITLASSNSAGSLTPGATYVVTVLSKLTLPTGEEVFGAPCAATSITLGGSDNTITVTVNGGGLTANGRAEVEYYCSLAGGSTLYYTGTSNVIRTVSSSAKQPYSTGGVLTPSIPAPFGCPRKYRNNLVGVSDYSNKLVFTTPIVDGEVPRIIRESEVTACSRGKPTRIEVLDDKLITFSDKSVDYLIGEPIDDLGNSSLSAPNPISREDGLVSFAACVKASDGIIFKGSRGFVYLNRNMTLDDSIGLPVIDYDSYSVLSSCFNEVEQTAYFGLSNGYILAFNESFKKWSVITSDYPSFTPSDLVMHGGTLYVLDAVNSKIWKQDTSFIDTSASYPVLFKMVTNWFSMANIAGYARTYWIELIGEKKSSGTLTVKIAYDFEDTYSQTLTFDLSTLTSGPLRLKIKPQRQKCSAFKLSIEDSATSGGEGLSLSALGFEIGTKFTQDKTPSSRHMG